METTNNSRSLPSSPGLDSTSCSDSAQDFSHPQRSKTSNDWATVPSLLRKFSNAEALIINKSTAVYSDSTCTETSVSQQTFRNGYDSSSSPLSEDSNQDNTVANGSLISDGYASAIMAEQMRGLGLGNGTQNLHPVPTIMEESMFELVDTPSSTDPRESSPAPDAALASITGNGLPPTSALSASSLPPEPSEVMDRGDQMYTKALSQGLLPPSPTQEEFLTDPFEDRLFMSFATNPQNQRQFLPKGQLNNLVHKASVIRELRKKPPRIKKYSLERFANMICDNPNPAKGLSEPACGKSFQKIFAILVLINMVPAIAGFLEEGICDADLPLVKASEKGGVFDLRVEARRDCPLKAFKSWTRVNIRNFEEYQWTILPPFFTKGERKNVKHYVLEPHIVLPFTSTTHPDDMGSAEMHRGGFSQVFKAEIHPDHHDFSDPALEPRLRQNTFAVKCLNSPNKTLFQKEVRVLKKFSGESHPHLISLLATYEQSNRFYLIFPWAESDLMKYWKVLNPKPSNATETILWIAEQCRGISDGLVRIHQYNSSDLQDKEAQPNSQLLSPSDALARDNHESAKRQFGRHGDIKPENILWFRDTRQGVLRISDFGLAELNSRLSRSNQHGSQVPNSPTYRPPECDLRRRIIRQSYDIWSLGCLFLEFITWSLGGKDLLLEFAWKRSSPDPYLSGIDSDTFFQIDDPEAKDSAAASVKQAVIEVSLPSLLYQYSISSLAVPSLMQERNPFSSWTTDFTLILHAANTCITS
ncbi:protein kinase [Colletotrichum melonis]|uniref:Protein kinase n=1 Tax=Colletotrichum melonis TaxID=1209925 RepID=A0AAI9TXF3_9PEZI|nr:protein kinase [Colletotrichum melonis]